jgi:hypothetical protein
MGDAIAGAGGREKRGLYGQSEAAQRTGRQVKDLTGGVDESREHDWQ